MLTQRGFALTGLAYLFGAIALLGMLGTAVWKIRESGKDVVRLEWAAANLKADEDARELMLQRREDGRDAAILLITSNLAGKESDRKWQEARNALRDTTLAVCPTPRPGEKDAATTIVASPDRGLRLTYSFLRLYDGAWTGQDGKPVFGDPRGASEAAPAASAPSARGLGEVLDTHAENASRASENTRQHNKLIDLIRKLQGRK